MDQQYLDQNHFLSCNQAHSPRKAQTKIFFLVVESSNTFSGVENHDSVEGIEQLTPVSKTPLQSHLSKQNNRKNAKISSYHQRLKKANEQIRRQAQEHQEQFQQLKAQQMQLTLELEKKYSQVASLQLINHQLKYQKLKKSRQIMSGIEETRSLQDEANSKRAETILTKTSQVDVSQPLRTPKFSPSLNDSSDGLINPEKIPQNRSKPSLTTMDSVPGMKESHRLTVSRHSEGLKKHRSDISQFNLSQLGQESSMTMSADRRNKQHVHASAQIQIPTKKTEPINENNQSQMERKQKEKETTSQPKPIQNEQLKLQKPKQTKERKMRMILIALILASLCLIGLNHKVLSGQL